MAEDFERMLSLRCKHEEDGNNVDGSGVGTKINIFHRM